MIDDYELVLQAIVALNPQYITVGVSMFRVAKQSFLTKQHDIISLKECCTLDSHRSKAIDHTKSKLHTVRQ